jgi:hypothetical protein
MLLVTKCVLILTTTLSETFLILRKIQRVIVIKVKTFLRKDLIVLVRFERNLNFLNRFSKKVQL